jgi:hypothetical protein
MPCDPTQLPRVLYRVRVGLPCIVGGGSAKQRLSQSRAIAGRQHVIFIVFDALEIDETAQPARASGGIGHASCYLVFSELTSGPLFRGLHESGPPS